jgi:hypothetical protein
VQEWNHRSAEERQIGSGFPKTVADPVKLGFLCLRKDNENGLGHEFVRNGALRWRSSCLWIFGWVAHRPPCARVFAVALSLPLFLLLSLFFRNCIL